VIKVGFVSIFYPLFMGRYMLEALLRRKDVEVWTAGPFTGRWIPWDGGMNLPQRYIYTPNFPMPYGAPSRLVWKMVEAKAPWEPDIWINVSSTLETVGRPSSGKYAVIAADPHVLNYDAERAKADLFFNMQRPYMKPGDRWLPYAYDPVWHAETTVPFEDRNIDATLLGLPYPNRTALTDRLKSRGRTVIYSIGDCYEDAMMIYHRSVVGLNWSSLQDTTARVFEIMGFGIVPVINRVPDLMDMFVDGEHFLGFDTLEEAVEQVDKALSDPKLAQEIGYNARRAVEPHSWDARMEHVLREARLVGGEDS
jgi:glycosyltransferase involved in cell wall biosynthesis